jgi:hypothetical protein
VVCVTGGASGSSSSSKWLQLLLLQRL